MMTPTSGSSLATLEGAGQLEERLWAKALRTSGRQIRESWRFLLAVSERMSW